MAFVGILEDIGDFLPNLVREYAPPDPPFSSIFIMIVGICLSTTIALISRHLIDLEKLKKYTREQKEYRKLQWKVQQTADRKLKLELDRRSRRMKRINSELSNMRMRPMLIYMIPLMLIFFSLSSFYTHNGHTETFHVSDEKVSGEFEIISGDYDDTYYSQYCGRKNDRKKEMEEVKTLDIIEREDKLEIQILFDNLIDYPEFKIELQINETGGAEDFTISVSQDKKINSEGDWVQIALIQNGTLNIESDQNIFNDHIGHIAYPLSSRPISNFTLRIRDTSQDHTTPDEDATIKIDSIELRAHRDNRAAVIPYRLKIPLLPETFFGEDYNTPDSTYTSLHFVWWYFAVNISIGGIVQKVAGLQPE
ncbi:MAG: EMC3/TMCO1 family protein [Promethearchaeota archaeon]